MWKDAFGGYFTMGNDIVSTLVQKRPSFATVMDNYFYQGFVNRGFQTVVRDSGLRRGQKKVKKR